MAENEKGLQVLSRIKGAGKELSPVQEIQTPFGIVRSRPILALLQRGVHTYNVQGREMVNSDGYELLAGAAGVRIITPRIIMRYDREVKGIVEVGNPDIIVDDGGRIIAIWVRKIAVGFLPNGELSIVERTLYFNIESYFITSLMAKVRGKKAAARTISKEEWDAKKPADKEGWAFVMTVPELNAGMMIFLEHDDVQAALKERQSISQMAERRATTIAERLVFDHHPGIAQGNLASQFKDGDTIRIGVVNVRHQSAALERLFLDLTMGKPPELPDIPIHYDRRIVTTEGEIIDAEAAGEVAPGEDTGDEEEAPKNGGASEADEKLIHENLLNQVRQIEKNIPKEAYKQIERDAAKEYGFTNRTDASTKALQWMLGEMLSIAGGEVDTNENT